MTNYYAHNANRVDRSTSTSETIPDHHYQPDLSGIEVQLNVYRDRFIDVDILKLREACTRRGLVSHGNRLQVINRLLEHLRQHIHTHAEVETDMFKSVQSATINAESQCSESNSNMLVKEIANKDRDEAELHTGLADACLQNPVCKSPVTGDEVRAVSIGESQTILHNKIRIGPVDTDPQQHLDNILGKFSDQQHPSAPTKLNFQQLVDMYVQHGGTVSPNTEFSAVLECVGYEYEGASSLVHFCRAGLPWVTNILV